MSNKRNEISSYVEFDFMPLGQAIKKAREAKRIPPTKLPFFYFGGCDLQIVIYK